MLLKQQFSFRYISYSLHRKMQIDFYNSLYMEFTEFGLGPDILGAGICFLVCFFLYNFFLICARLSRLSVHIKLPLSCHIIRLC